MVLLDSTDLNSQQLDDQRGIVIDAVAEALTMALLELSDHLGAGQSLTPGQHQRELGTPMAQVQSDKERGRVRGIALLHQQLAALLFQGDHPLGEAIQERLAQGLTQMLQPSTLTRLPHAIGRKNTRHRMQQDGVQGQLIGQSAGMLPAGPAMGDQDPHECPARGAGTPVESHRPSAQWPAAGAPSASCSGLRPNWEASAVKACFTTARSGGKSPLGPNTAGKRSSCSRPSNRLASVIVSGPPAR